MVPSGLEEIEAPPMDLFRLGQEVHVWCFDVQKYAVQHFLKILSNAERERAERFQSADSRVNFIVSHGLLRSLLGGYLMSAPEGLDFRENAWGKPFLSEEPSLHFNLSHAGGCGMIGIRWGRPLGVDLEEVRELEDMENVARLIFTGKEFDFWKALDPTKRKRLFFSGWTRKEAFVKAMGRGLSYSLQEFEVFPPETACVQFSGETWGGETWTLRDLSLGTRYVGAICLEGDMSGVEVRDVGGIL